MLRMLVFFFFQAEDGIRDIGVTGVQTCALPIWSGRRTSPRRARPAAGDGRGSPVRGHGEPSLVPVSSQLASFGLFADSARSEERRVGKECRSRWSPYH